ncbi:EamA family transporter [Roseateles sp. LYH14W]|uniref:EamA family transporter n=1 Tax=Pelomonas parva TaxID=3299032 RepID=A0ABW7F9G9_9BURK
MPAHVLALVLTAALLHAVWNLAAKKWGGGPHFVLTCAIGVVVVWLPAVLWIGVAEVPGWTLLHWSFLAASAVVHLLYFNCLVAGYRNSDLTVVYPVARGSGPLLTALAAVLLLDERLGLYGALGLAGVVSGILLITMGPRLIGRGLPHDPVAARRRLHGIYWGAATGALIAGYTVLDGYAVKMLAMSPLLLDYFGNVLRVVMQLPVTLRQTHSFWPEVRSSWRGILAVAVLGPAAYVLVLLAVKEAPLSRVAPAREVSMLFAALLGGQLLGEKEKGWRVAGAALIGAGVVALAV